MKILASDDPDHVTPTPTRVCASTEELIAALAPGTLVLGADALPPEKLLDRLAGVVFTFARAPNERWLEVTRGHRCLLAGPEGPIYRWHPPLQTRAPVMPLEHIWLVTRTPAERERIIAAVNGATWTHDRTVADVVVDLAATPVLTRDYLRDLARGALLVSDRSFAAELAIEDNEDFAKVTGVDDAAALLSSALAAPRTVFGVRVRGRQKIDEVFSPARAYTLLFKDASRLLRAGARA